MAISISVRGLAKYMTASAAGQRKILRDFKYPNPEGTAQAAYYRDARNIISRYHENRHPSLWLVQKGASLVAESKRASGSRATRLGHNGRAVTEYASQFGRKSFSMLDELTMVSPNLFRARCSL